MASRHGLALLPDNGGYHATFANVDPQAFSPTRPHSGPRWTRGWLQVLTDGVMRMAGLGDSCKGTGWRVFCSSHTSELRDFPKGQPYGAAVERAILAWPGPPAMGTARPAASAGRPHRAGTANRGQPALGPGYPATARQQYRSHRPGRRLPVLLFGQNMTRIAAVTTSQMTRHDDGVTIQLGQNLALR